MSSLASLCQFPHLIRQIFRTLEVTADGFYEVVLFIDGHWQIVFVDDYLPVQKKNNLLYFAKPNGNEIWVIILEKIWAKVNGGYLNTISGKAAEPLKALTGFATEVIFHENEDRLFQTLKSFDKAGHIVCTSTNPDAENYKVGLAKSHAYSVIGVHEINDKGQSVRLVHLRNPWGHFEWNGDWSDNSKLWTPELKQTLHLVSADDGTFFMALSDFVKYFNRSHVCHIMYDCNIKKFNIDSQSIKKPHVYNLLMNTKDSKVSISVHSKHWRYNREVRGKSHPFTIVIAEYQLHNKKLVNVEGAFSAEGYTEYVKFLKKGLYAVWIYCNYNECQDPLPEDYVVSFASAYKYKVRFENYDENFDFIRHMIVSSVREKNADKPYKELISNNLENTGIGYCCLLSDSEQDEVYEVTPHLKNMSLLPPYADRSDQESFELVVPAGGPGICLAMKTSDNSYSFKANSTHSGPSENPIQSYFSLGEFVSTKVSQEDNEDEDNYYQYYSSSFKKAKDEEDDD